MMLVLHQKLQHGHLLSLLSDTDDQEWSGGGEGDAAVTGGPSQHSGCGLPTELSGTEIHCSTADEIP